MSSQKQSASEGSIALQSEGALTVNIGTTKAELAALLSDFGKALMTFHAEGQQKAEQRLDQFRAEVLTKFEQNQAADPNAFKDTDFQYALHEAQTNYVRTDDEQISESLVNLLTERSRYSGRTRTSLSLNNAIETVGNITREEIAVLTLLFMARRTIVSPGTESKIVEHYANHMVPLLTDLPEKSSSLDYLVSLGCLTPTPFSDFNFWDQLRLSYAAALVPPFTVAEFDEAVPGISKKSLSILRLVSEPLNFSDQSVNFSLPGTTIPERGSARSAGRAKYCFTFINKEQLASVLQQENLSEFQAQISQMIDSKCPSADLIADRFIGRVSELRAMAERWEKLRLGTYSPTSLGITIAHSNAKRLWKSFDAPLTTWVD